MDEQDRQEILRLVGKYCEVVSSGDEEEFRALWCGREDDTVISIVTEYRGPERVAAFLARLRSLYSSIELVADGEPSVRPLTEDVAIVVFRYHTRTVYRETGEPGGIEGLETQVAHRTPGGWKLSHLHYSKQA